MNEIIISDLQGELGIRDIRHFFLEKTGRQTLMSDPLLVGGYIKVTYIYITYNIGFINPLTTFSLWISMDFNKCGKGYW